MATQATITVFDGASTPVVHTLQPDGVTREKDTFLATWKEVNPAVPDSCQLRTYQMRQKLRSGTTKTTSRVDVTVMESISGQNAQGYTAAPKAAYSDRFELTNLASPRSTETTKRIAMQILLNWTNNITTTVTPVSAGVVADLHQRLLVVS